MAAQRHPMFAQALRNERKRILFEKWLALGSVTVNFDATRDDVACPEQFKADSDYWIGFSEAKIYTTHLEGKATYPNKKIGTFEVSIPWDAVHAFYSIALHERHIYNGDVDRAVTRAEVKRMATYSKARIPS